MKKDQRPIIGSKKKINVKIRLVCQLDMVNKCFKSLVSFKYIRRNGVSCFEFFQKQLQCEYGVYCKHHFNNLT